MTRLCLLPVLLLLLAAGAASAEFPPPPEQVRHLIFDPMRGLQRASGEKALQRAPARRRGEAGGTIVFLGDSLTEGPGLAKSQTYPALIQLQSRKDGRKLECVNAGVGGNTSAQGLARLDKALGLEPSILVVNFGTNDANLGRGNPAATSAALRKNIDAIVTRAKKHGARVVLVGTRLPSWYGAAMVDGFERAFRSVAKERGVPLAPGLLDNVWGRKELWLNNGHPNAGGHKVMARNVWKVLAPVVERLR